MTTVTHTGAVPGASIRAVKVTPHPDRPDRLLISDSHYYVAVANGTGAWSLDLPATNVYVDTVQTPLQAYWHINEPVPLGHRYWNVFIPQHPINLDDCQLKRMPPLWPLAIRWWF